jgi:hypothetical protein
MTRLTDTQIDLCIANNLPVRVDAEAYTRYLIIAQYQDTVFARPIGPTVQLFKEDLHGTVSFPTPETESETTSESESETETTSETETETE